MPAVSKSQVRKMFTISKKLGKEFAVKGKKFDKLPEHVKPARKAKKKG